MKNKLLVPELAPHQAAWVRRHMTDKTPRNGIGTYLWSLYGYVLSAVVFSGLLYPALNPGFQVPLALKNATYFAIGSSIVTSVLILLLVLFGFFGIAVMNQEKALSFKDFKTLVEWVPKHNWTLLRTCNRGFSLLLSVLILASYVVSGHPFVALLYLAGLGTGLQFEKSWEQTTLARVRKLTPELIHKYEAYLRDEDPDAVPERPLVGEIQTSSGSRVIEVERQENGVWKKA